MAARSVPLEESPEDIAKRMVRYTEIHVLSGTHVRADPALMASMSAELQASGDEVPMVAGAIQDPLAALKYYNETLAKEPHSYRDHYLHFHYATSAAILTSKHIVKPRARENPSFFKLYTKAFAKLKSESEQRLNPGRPSSNLQRNSTPSISTRRRPTYATISLDDALKLVKQIDTLMRSKFYALEERGIEESGGWQLERYSVAKEGKEFEVRFEQPPVVLPFDEEELVQLLSKSIDMSAPV